MANRFDVDQSSGLPNNRQDRTDLAESLAEELLLRAKSELGIVGPPYDVRKIASLRRIRRIYLADIKKAGILSPDRNGFSIYIKRLDKRTRQNFTCAHEIGHTYFYSTESDIPVFRHESTEPESQIVESFCNSFAAALLMPKNDVRALSHDFRQKPSIESLTRLAHIFDVGLLACFFRLASLIRSENKRCFMILFRMMSDIDKEVAKLGVTSAITPENINISQGISAEDLGLKIEPLLFKDSKTDISLEEYACLEIADSKTKRYKQKHVRLNSNYKVLGNEYSHIIGEFIIP